MLTTSQELLKLKQQEQEFLELTQTCNRDELVKCARVLAMYIALYRQQFGEVPLHCHAKLQQTNAFDDELIQITMEGLHEAVEMLKTVMLQHRDDISMANRDSRCIN